LARSIGRRAPCRFATIKVPFPPRPQRSLHSTLYFILLPLSTLPPVTSRAAQPPEFGSRDVVGLTWSPCAILSPSKLTALIRTFLEPNFPQRWSDFDAGVEAWPGQPGRSLPNPAAGPLPSSLFSFCLFERPSEQPRFLLHAGIENAPPSRLLAAPLTAPFLVNLYASSPEARTWKIGRGRQYEATNEGNAASSATVSLGGGAQLRLENRQHDLRLRRQFSVLIE
jgi:hypothetical protein